MAIDPARVGAVLLAAGRSRRFGEQDKLAQPVGGMALLDHAAMLLGALPFAARILVAPPDRAPRAGFTIVANPDPERGIGHSLSLAVAALEKSPVTACLVLLGDMPRVGRDHVERLLDAYTDEPGLVASQPPGGRAMVPALFGRRHFPALAGLTGDRGAQPLLAGAILVPVDAERLLDIDRPEDLLRI